MATPDEYEDDSGHAPIGIIQLSYLASVLDWSHVGHVTAEGRLPRDTNTVLSRIRKIIRSEKDRKSLKGSYVLYFIGWLID